jgi:carbamoyltransferase
MMLTFDAQPDMAPRIIAALHPADLTGRAQIIPEGTDHPLARILADYQQRRGSAVLLNTSLNLHGQPIARTAADALAVSAASDLRYLQLGPYLVRKGSR